MSPETQTPATPRPPACLVAIEPELREMRDKWWWLVLLGSGLVLLGLIALGSAVTLYAMSAVLVLVLGVLLVIGGVGQVISAFWQGRWSGFMLHLLIALLYVVVGALILENPDAAIEGLTLVLALFLIVGGLFRVVSAMTIQFPSWGWHMLNGVVSLLLGILIARIVKNSPEAALIVIGVFIAVEMLFNGWTWIMLGLFVRRIPVAEQAEA